MSHKQVIVLRKDLNMRKGKMVAQGAHASMGAILAQMTRDGDRITLDLTDQRLAPWITGQFKKICVSVDSETELLAVYEQARSANIVCSLIQDSGLTEFGGVKTYTAVAVGPDLESVINAITGNLPLL
jgi:PTH2 family peptidyl-tRNA hydrolase